jgi:hypothetical protein
MIVVGFWGLGARVVSQHVADLLYLCLESLSGSLVELSFVPELLDPP